MNKIYISLLCFSFISCGKENNKEHEKDLFSKWTASDGTFWDLSNGVLNTELSLSAIDKSGAICNGYYGFLGSQNSGSFKIQWNWDCNGMQDIIGTYTKTKDTLTLCVQPSNCQTFK